MKLFFVGLSGGVDSSVAAKRLIEHGHTVVGVFIKVWQPDFLQCDWEKERLDAMRVAAHLDIPFLTFDAVSAYKQNVADYMISEYRDGRTPNPDIMCNQHVKFGAFLDFALSQGATKIATGHYAQIVQKNGRFTLERGHDKNKDQSYFLWTLSQEQLAHTYFPVGNSTKTDIRKEAQRAGIPTFAKNDSQGICFLGQIDIKEFLSHYIMSEKGNVHDEHGNIVGTHDGALFFTIGQRHGFIHNSTTSENKPVYVYEKDMDTNTITVSSTQRYVLDTKIELSHINQITEFPTEIIEAQFRYRQTPCTVSVTAIDTSHCRLEVLSTSVEYPSKGQSCVLYTMNTCLGGGIIS